MAKLGPGLITGASDDDPSGIATYSQVGAQFGFGMLWVALFSYPLMVGVQAISARIGRVTGHGIAENMNRRYPAWLVHLLVLLFLVANTINLAADIGAMGEALKLLIGGPAHFYALGFGLLSAALQIFLPYPRYVPFLKWLTVTLFAYVATVFAVQIPWREVLYHTVVPSFYPSAKFVTGLMAVLGTTISPYLFFWQASQEVEDQRAAPGEEPLKQAPDQAREQLSRIRTDTWIGMGFSNLVAYFIILTTAVTLHRHGVHDIESSAQAAEALRPLAGEFAFLLFSLGIIGTGLLAVPVLAGSAAYAVGESFRWRVGMSHKPLQAKRFYGVIAAATLSGALLGFTSIDPIKALYWSAVINGVIAVPILIGVMLMATDPEIMGKFVVTHRLKLLGWVTTGVMAIAAAALFVHWGK